MNQPKNVDVTVFSACVMSVSHDEILLVNVNAAAYYLIQKGFLGFAKFADRQFSNFFGFVPSVAYQVF
jgi:hypothetical protein